MKRLTKFLATVLAFVLAFSPLTVFNAGAVEFPDGISREQTDSVIPKLNTLIKTLLASGGKDTDIKGMLYDTLYKDETLNGIFSAIYTALGENADALSIIGVDISPAAIARALSGYSSISKKVASCSDINAVIAASKNFKWDVSSKNEFGKALAAMLSPFNALLNALLCSGKVSINSFLAIQGDDGYTAAIVPLLTALDCPGIMTSADFAASAAKNQNNIIRNIVSMAFDAVDKLLEDPVIGLTETLPKVALYLDSGKLSASITALLEPLSLKVAGVLTIPGIADLITSAADLEGSLNIDELLENADLSSVLGEDVKLQIPEIELKKLAECATENGGTYTVDRASAFVVIMDFLLETVKLNKESLGAIMGGSDTMKMLEPLLAKSNSELIKTIVSLFSITSAPANNYQWVYPTVTPTQVTYTPKLTANDYLKYLDKVDPLLTDFVKESDPEGTIEGEIKKAIYSNSLVTELVVGIFSLLGTQETAPLFALLGMNVTPSGVADSINKYYPYTAKQLYRFTSWERLKGSYLSWGFYDGDKEGFERALTRVLTPFIPLLSCVLAGQNVTLMDSITIPGADGYNTAIIPLLEALGCDSADIKTFAQYQTGAGTTAVISCFTATAKQKVISDILEPVTGLIDRLAASPVKTACSILPNVIYFMESGLMNGVIENMLYPVKYMLDTAGLGELLTDAFKDMEKIDINSLVGDLTKNMDLGIKLPELDIKAIGTLGTPTAMTSKRVANGAYAQYTYLTADTPAVFLTVLRYLVAAISMEENSGLLTGLMGSEGGSSAEGMPDMFAMYAGNITEKFKNMTNDEIIEWLCDLLFSDPPVADIPDENEEIPTIIYEEKFELSTTAKLLIVAGVIGLIALIYYVLSVSGKLDKIKLKRRKKQEMKRRAEESKKLIKAGGVAVDKMTDTPEKKEKKKKAEKAKAPAPVKAQPPVITEAPVKEEAPVTAEAAPVIAESKEEPSEEILFTDAVKKAKPSKPVYDASTVIYTEEALKIIEKQRLKDEKPKSERAIARHEKVLENNERKAERRSQSKLPDEKAQEKLLKRKLAAEKKSRKNELKIHKQYEKAKLQAEKKNNKKK